MTKGARNRGFPLKRAIYTTSKKIPPERVVFFIGRNMRFIRTYEKVGLTTSERRFFTIFLINIHSLIGCLLLCPP